MCIYINAEYWPEHSFKCVLISNKLIGKPLGGILQYAVDLWTRKHIEKSWYELPLAINLIVKANLI